MQTCVICNAVQTCVIGTDLCCLEQTLALLLNVNVYKDTLRHREMKETIDKIVLQQLMINIIGVFRVVIRSNVN
jgi:hypothetical protein